VESGKKPLPALLKEQGFHFHENVKKPNESEVFKKRGD